MKVGAAMRKAAWAVAVAAWAGLSLAACAGPKAVGPGGAEQREVGPADQKAAAAPEGEAPPRVDPKTAGKDHGASFVDRENGFTITRPRECWSFKPGEELNTENIVVPVIIADADSGAQVVVQVAPAVASPAQFAQRLTTGLQSRDGFSTGEVQPIPLAEGAVGFDFTVGDQVHGRVAIVEGSAGRVYVLLATWPRGSPHAVEQDVDDILGSMRTSQE
ncbi:MAG: hypothetical protein HY901_37975 [Deltaproteobacteria bacterium]|nr:hypothetical protein [Deltaproteobacteria bacterium]